MIIIIITIIILSQMAGSRRQYDFLQSGEMKHSSTTYTSSTLLPPSTRNRSKSQPVRSSFSFHSSQTH